MGVLYKCNIHKSSRVGVFAVWCSWGFEGDATASAPEHDTVSLKYKGCNMMKSAVNDSSQNSNDNIAQARHLFNHR